MRKGSYNGTEATGRTMPIASNAKFQKVERLNTMVGEVTQRQKETAMRSVRNGMSGRVLDMIKQRIKTKYDNLYENYEDNKTVILRQIQHVESSMASENTVARGYEHVLKEKSQHDRAKADLEAKQKNLKKLTEVRNQLRLGSEQQSGLQDAIWQKGRTLEELEAAARSLDYESMVLHSMKADRRRVKMSLQEKYDRMHKEEQERAERAQKLEHSNHKKQAILGRIEGSLKKEEQLEIPENLAEELERKLQEYEGKQVYENIVRHQQQLGEEHQRQQLERVKQQRENCRRERVAREKEELKDYEMAYNFYLLKQQEEEKIKKICGVASISDIANNSLHTDFENLGLIETEIQNQIARVKQQNSVIQEDIKKLLNREASDYTEMSLREVEAQKLAASKQSKKAEMVWGKKSVFLREWQSLIHMMNSKDGSVKRGEMGSTIARILQQVRQRKDMKVKDCPHQEDAEMVVGGRNSAPKLVSDAHNEKSIQSEQSNIQSELIRD